MLAVCRGPFEAPRLSSSVSACCVVHVQHDVLVGVCCVGGMIDAHACMLAAACSSFVVEALDLLVLLHGMSTTSLIELLCHMSVSAHAVACFAEQAAGVVLTSHGGAWVCCDGAARLLQCSTDQAQGRRAVYSHACGVRCLCCYRVWCGVG